MGCLPITSKRIGAAAFAPESEGRFVELSGLSSLRLILPSKAHELRRIIERVCQRHGVLVKPDLELDSLDAVLSLLAKRELRYHTILPARSVAADVAARRLSSVAIRSTEMMRTIVVMERVSSKRRPDISALHSKIIELAHEIGSYSDCVA